MQSVADMLAMVMSLQDRAAALVEGVLEGGPCYLVEMVCRGSIGSQVVDVFIESDAVLDAYTLARLSREIGYTLDVAGVMPGPYTLTVSTPGADRPLRLPRQYRKMVGRNLRVHYRLPSGKYTEVTGLLEKAGDESITLTAGSVSPSIMYSDILWAKAQLPW